MTFKDFELSAELQDGLDAMGIKKPTPIQEQAIPAILSDKDVIGTAQTGTGKTAAFTLPILNKLQPDNDKGIKCLILVPTRELAQQIDQQIEGFSYFVSVTSIAVYGGGDGSQWGAQKEAILQGADILVATPGRMIAHINLGYVNLDTIKYFILDEADKMLDMGFYDDIMKIANHLPKKRQTLLFSATMPNKINELAIKILNNPVQINIAKTKPAAGVLQAAYMVYEPQKVPLISSLLKGKDVNSVIIFTSTKKDVTLVANDLARAGMMARGIHSDYAQKEREEIMLEFKNRKYQILVATDIISRGIDIDKIELIINYNVPQDPEDYIHRVGRTARAKSQGVAITFITEKDQFQFMKIEELIESEIFKLPVPADIGETPEYNPKAPKPRNYKNSNPRGKKNYSRKK